MNEDLIKTSILSLLKLKIANCQNDSNVQLTSKLNLVLIQTRLCYSNLNTNAGCWQHSRNLFLRSQELDFIMEI